MIKAKVIRLGFFTLAVCVFAFLVLDIGLSSLYVYALTHPGCAEPLPINEGLSSGEISLSTRDDLKLRAWYYPSKNGAAIIALGGVGGSLGDRLPPVQALIEAGYGVLQIDSRSCAQPARRVTLGGNELFDADAGLEYLLSNAEIDPGRIGVFGFSMGGVTALRLAARHPQVQAVVAEGGYDQLGKHITQPQEQISLTRRVFLYTVAINFWLQTGLNPWSISPLDDIAAISPRPVLLIFGEHEIDRACGYLQFKAAGEPKTLWVVPNGDHGTNFDLDRFDYTSRVLDFFDLSLLP
jgi:dipeptidyl aminopeptidase/acylaminoacyl peptidase